jgi:hypothetical protein
VGILVVAYKAGRRLFKWRRSRRSERPHAGPILSGSPRLPAVKANQDVDPATLSADCAALSAAPTGDGVPLADGQSQRVLSHRAGRWKQQRRISSAEWK